MGFHKNSNENMDEHHLYEIIDSEDNTVYKYGICGKPLNSDGTSSRANEQVTVFNRLVGYVQYFANVLLLGIPGRAKAKEIEKEYISRFEQENGHRPRGNP
ncbi:MAG: hypothetical protein KBA66_11100 [Leptospiraceae bacterium]|nr:hypothetical protein [Leptospiraceae bacterium]